MSKFNKYIQMAEELKMVNTMIISPDDIYFDIRAILKRKARLSEAERKRVIPGQSLREKEKLPGDFGSLCIPLVCPSQERQSRSCTPHRE